MMKAGDKKKQYAMGKKPWNLGIYEVFSAAVCNDPDTFGYGKCGGGVTCQTGNDIMVRYDTVAAPVASGSSCLSLIVPPTTLTLFLQPLTFSERRRE